MQSKLKTNYPAVEYLFLRRDDERACNVLRGVAFAYADWARLVFHQSAFLVCIFHQSVFLMCLIDRQIVCGQQQHFCLRVWSAAESATRSVPFRFLLPSS